MERAGKKKKREYGSMKINLKEICETMRDNTIKNSKLVSVQFNNENYCKKKR